MDKSRTIRLIDSEFPHSKYSTKFPNLLDYTWSRDNNSVTDDIIVFTDRHLNSRSVSSYKNTKKVAWLLEPEAIRPSIYKNLNQYKNFFDIVYTSHIDYIDDKKIFYQAFGGCWIENENKKIHSKTKNISFISSRKTITPNQKVRHNIYNHYKSSNIIDFYGAIANPNAGYKTPKIASLKDYKYHVVVENTSTKGYFSEKIIDCFMTGTIPIYLGCLNIGDYFNLDGIIIFNNLNELIYVIDNINKYDVSNEIIQENFELAQKYTSAEESFFPKLLNLKK